MRRRLPGPSLSIKALHIQSVTMTKIVELKGQPCLTPARATNANTSPRLPLMSPPSARATNANTSHAIIQAGDCYSNAALVFCDFAAAFPPIARTFIFLVFRAIGLPIHIIRALRALYDSNIHLAHRLVTG